MTFHFKVLAVAVSCYNPTPAQGWGCGKITADGSRIPDNVNVKWCAVSRDMLRDNIVSFGDTIVFNMTDYVVKDKMNERFRRKIDILQHESEPIFHFNQANVIIKRKVINDFKVF